MHIGTWRRGLCRAAGAVVLAGLLLTTGCRSPSKAEQASEVVRRFFAALPTGDCSQLEPLLAPVSSDRPCAVVVKELNDHSVQLLEVLSAQEDGRTPDAILVRTRLAQDGRARAQPSILRVERHGGTWRLRL